MKRGLLVIAAAGLLTTPAAAEMSVASFLTKTDALKAKGILALGSPDLGLLRDEVKRATISYRDTIKDAKAKGRTPHSCPPEKMKMNSDELITHFKTVPHGQAKRVSVRAAFYDMMKKRYPCP